jgi:hypothetical protein
VLFSGGRGPADEIEQFANEGVSAMRRIRQTSEKEEQLLIGEKVQEGILFTQLSNPSLPHLNQTKYILKVSWGV